MNCTQSENVKSVDYPHKTIENTEIKSKGTNDYYNYKSTRINGKHIEGNNS